MTIASAAGFHIFPRRCLLMTIGRTPQVVTETVYALVTAPADRQFVPTEIHIVTTEEGRRQAELVLLDSGHARLRQLCQDYGLDRDSIRFDSSTIHVVRDAAGIGIEDVRTGEQNQSVADAIVQLVRSFTSDPTMALHVSLAGGRKTMGFYLGYALSLFGRAQDRVSHVLVEAPFEGLPDFYYPAPKRQILRLRDGKGTIDASTARVELADIPIVSLRDLLDSDLLGGDAAGYAEIVGRARGNVGSPPQIELSLRDLRVVAAGRPVPMPSASFAWYLFFCTRAQQGLPGVQWRNTDTHAVLAELFKCVDRVQLYGGDRLDMDRWAAAGQLDVDAADRLRSKLNKAIRKALGPGASKPYLIHREGSRGKSFYSLRLPASSIQITE